MWDNTTEHNSEAEWLHELKEDVNCPTQEDLYITKDKVEK